MTASNIAGGDRAYLRYNAKADTWLLRTPEDGDSEIEPPTLLLDLVNLRTGWWLVRAGQAPDSVLDPPEDGATASQPGPDHKRGFVVIGFGAELYPDVIEFSATSASMRRVIQDLRDAYAAPGHNANRKRGLVPRVAFGASEAHAGRFGRVFQPSAEIEGWEARPEELPDEAPGAPAESVRAAPRKAPQPVKATASKPTGRQAAPQADADEDEPPSRRAAKQAAKPQPKQAAEPKTARGFADKFVNDDGAAEDADY
jgi:hypothetical protein